MDEKLYWLGFSAFPLMGPARFKRLIAEFKTAKNAREATSFARSLLTKLIGEETTERFEKFKKTFSIEKYRQELEKKQVWFLTLEDEDYPRSLKQIQNPPFVLYGRGNKELSFLTIAVVGTRRITERGREVTKLLTSELVLNGFTIVSGLALGVDAVSHKTALENNGETAAVLGCGVDCCNPAENQSIYNSILQNRGMIVSEFPLRMRPTQWTFPARNRIIAGLSLAVLVTEGAEDSGALITADYAFKNNRKVFAVPGPITSSLSRGPYKLIAKGAKLVTKAEDILKELKIQNAKVKIKTQNLKIKNAAREEQDILVLLQNERLSFDEIVRRTKIESSKLGGILSLMEIKGMVKSLDGGIFPNIYLT